MLLKLLVLIGLSIYFFINKEWVFGLLCLAGCIPIWGLIIAIILSILLIIITQYKIAGIILGLLILINLVGNEIMKRKRRKEYINQDNIVVNFIRYCKEYLITIKGFYENDAELAILDPYLGVEMDKVKSEWAIAISDLGEDPDRYLIEFDFYSDKMEMINKKLNDYSDIFNNRKEKIKEYLKEIGHKKGFE